MRRAASLNANQTRRQGLEERQYFRPLQLPPQYCLAGCIDPVQLEDTLGDVQTDCGNLHGGRLLQLVALNSPSLAHRCRQGSSTASDLSPTERRTSQLCSFLARRLLTHLIAQAQPELAVSSPMPTTHPSVGAAQQRQRQDEVSIKRQKVQPEANRPVSGRDRS